MKRSIEERLQVVQQAKSGKPIKVLSREYGLHENRILTWVRMYDRYGLEGIKDQPMTKFDVKFKEELVRLHLQKSVTLAQLVVDYRVSRCSVENWARKVRKHGYAALQRKKAIDRQVKNNIMARPKKREPQTELEKLQAENLRLRAENALLKKVRALVMEKRARAIQNGQEPSTD